MVTSTRSNLFSFSILDILFCYDKTAPTSIKCRVVEGTLLYVIFRIVCQIAPCWRSYAPSYLMLCCHLMNDTGGNCAVNATAVLYLRSRHRCRHILHGTNKPLRPRKQRTKFLLSPYTSYNATSVTLHDDKSKTPRRKCRLWIVQIVGVGL